MADQVTRTSKLSVTQQRSSLAQYGYVRCRHSIQTLTVCNILYPHIAHADPSYRFKRDIKVWKWRASFKVKSTPIIIIIITTLIIAHNPQETIIKMLNNKHLWFENEKQSIRTRDLQPTIPIKTMPQQHATILHIVGAKNSITTSELHEWKCKCNHVRSTIRFRQ